jgi:hypothetical protein
MTLAPRRRVPASASLFVVGTLYVPSPSTSLLASPRRVRVSVSQHPSIAPTSWPQPFGPFGRWSPNGGRGARR